MLRKLLLVVIVLSLISGSLSCGTGKSDVSGTYLCTQGSKDYDKGDVLELKKDGSLYVHAPGESGVSGKWTLDGDEIYLIFEFFGMTWKGNIKGDTISLEEGSVWIKEKESATKPTGKDTQDLTSSPPETDVQAIRPGMISLGDISCALTSVEREEQATYLYFAITKLGDTGSIPASIKITLTDDRDNEYEGELDVTPEGSPANFLTLLPQDFTYVIRATMTMPKAAPIMRVKLAETEEVSFKEVRLANPQFKSAFGTQLLKAGVAVSVGDSLVFSAERITPDLHTWAVPVTIENKDYNELHGWLQVTVQYSDGTIETTPSSAQTVSVPGVSKKTTCFTLAPLLGKDDPDVRTLLMFYRDEASKQETLKLWPISNSDFPPRVGQGTGSGEELFVEAYQQNGGEKVMGDPLTLPRWLAGSDKPKDERDVLVQEFPGVLEAASSAIIWDEQGNADSACVIPGVVWETYLDLGGPADWLGYPVGDKSTSTKGDPIVDFEGGYIGTNDGDHFEVFRYPSGRIAFTGSGAARTIYVVDLV